MEMEERALLDDHGEEVETFSPHFCTPINNLGSFIHHYS